MKKENDLYNYFDLNEKASTEDIKKAFRKKAKKNHPDSKKGNRKEFEKANKYYKILINPTTRLEYDETGNVENEKPSDTIILGMVCEIFEKCFKQFEGQYKVSNIFEMMRQSIDNEIQLRENEKSIIPGVMKNLKDIKKRIKMKYSDTGENVFTNIVDKKIKQLESVKRNQEKLIENWKKAYDFLKDYEYRSDKQDELMDFATVSGRGSFIFTA